MRVGLIAICVLWAAISLGLFISKKKLVDNGVRVQLKTIPPEDGELIRGDYLNLRYEINSLPAAWAGSPGPVPGKAVYVRLKQRDGFWQAESAQAGAPAPGESRDVFICGTVKNVSATALDLEYGIERVFVYEEDVWRFKGHSRGGRQPVVNVEAIISAGGRAVVNKVVIDGEEIDF